MQAITLEVILRAVFGVSDAERLGELRAPLVQILNMTESPAAKALGRITRRLGHFGPYQEMQRQLARSDGLIAEEIARRREDPRLSERDDVLSTLMAARFEDGGAMDDADLRDQLMTLLVVGHETTATALAWCFDLLLHHPEAMERLRGELASNGKDYINAVIQEALRVRPVIPVVGRRIGGELKVNGYELPAGTDLVICIYLIHTRPDLYPDPRVFRPERFLDRGPDTYTWIPFGGGTRRCLGAAFAEFEMRVVLRTVLERATLRAGSDSPERITRRNVTFSPKRGTQVVVEGRRKD
jgi:cytochrome P450